jgi:hypothetical protein
VRKRGVRRTISRKIREKRRFSSFRADCISLRNLIGRHNGAGRESFKGLRERSNGSKENDQEGEEDDQEVFWKEDEQEGIGQEGHKVTGPLSAGVAPVGLLCSHKRRIVAIGLSHQL